MKAPVKIPSSKTNGGYLVEDTFGEKYFIYEGEWTPRCGGFRWWIDVAHFVFEDSEVWSRIHCGETLEACLLQIQEWENTKINDLLKSKPPSLPFPTPKINKKINKKP